MVFWCACTDADVTMLLRYYVDVLVQSNADNSCYRYCKGTCSQSQSPMSVLSTVSTTVDHGKWGGNVYKRGRTLRLPP